MDFLKLLVQRPWLFCLGAADLLWFFGNTVWSTIAPKSFAAAFEPPRDILFFGVVLLSAVGALVAFCFMYEEHVPKQARKVCQYGFGFLGFAFSAWFGLTTTLVYHQYSGEWIALDLFLAGVVALCMTGAGAIIFLSCLPSEESRNRKESVEVFG